MNSFVWDNKFDTGIESLDAQHRKIFDYMTTIYEELTDVHQKCSQFNNLFDQLELLCQMHFMDEERMMDDMSYPSTAEHKHLHDLFLATVDQFKIDYKQCHSSNVVNDFNKLRWDFVTHVMNETLVLGEFIKGCTTKKSAEAVY
jgi:hemerythrin